MFTVVCVSVLVCPFQILTVISKANLHTGNVAMECKTYTALTSLILFETPLIFLNTVWDVIRILCCPSNKLSTLVDWYHLFLPSFAFISLISSSIKFYEDPSLWFHVKLSWIFPLWTEITFVSVLLGAGFL